MQGQWNVIGSGEIEERSFEIFRDESGELKVKTTQKEDCTSDIMPLVISAGDKIEIEATTPDELEQALQNDGDFSASAAKQVSDLAR